MSSITGPCRSVVSQFVRAAQTEDDAIERLVRPDQSRRSLDAGCAVARSDGAGEGETWSFRL